MTIQSRLRYGLAILIMLLLAGCIPLDMEQRITFHKDEAWETSILVEMSRQDLMDAGLSQDDIESHIQETINTLNPETVEVTWELMDLEDENLTYTIEAQGEGLDQLEKLIQGSDETNIRLTRTKGRDEIVFSAFPASSSGTNILVLEGSKIASSNGEEIDKGTVRWVNPQGQINAVLEPKGGFNFLIVFLILLAVGGMVVVGIIGGVFLLKRKS